MKNSKRIIIIGAGPTGLSAGLRLNKLGYDNYVIYEKESFPGGLCANFKDENGFSWDQGGHVLASSFKYADDIIDEYLSGDSISYERDAWVYILNSWLPYPFQNNLSCLPDETYKECLEGLKSIKGDCAGSNNFKEWILNNMGKGIAEYLMFPYNKKVWLTELEELGTSWISERVSLPENIREHDKNSVMKFGANALFKYPSKGGIGLLFNNISKKHKGKICYDAELKSLDPANRIVYLSGQKKDKYDILINTSPLDRLIGLMKNVDISVLKASKNLKKTALLLIGYGFNKIPDIKKHWIYFPEEKFPFFRINLLSNYVPDACPDNINSFSMILEIACSESSSARDLDISDKALRTLVDAGIIREEEFQSIITRMIKIVENAYPVPTIDRDKVLGKIQPYLEANDIYSRGRFGAWKYEIGNIDHSIMQGKEIIDRIISNKKEKVWNL